MPDNSQHKASHKVGTALIKSQHLNMKSNSEKSCKPISNLTQTAENVGELMKTGNLCENTKSVKANTVIGNT